MNKVLRTLMLFCLACVSMFASAQAPFADGEYYFKTTYGDQEYFLGGANNWGTRAALIPNSVAWNLVNVNDNVYQLDSYQSNGGDAHYLGSNGYVDSNAADIYFTEQADGTYTLSLEANAKYLQYLEVGFHLFPVLNWEGDAESALKWEVISTDKANIKQYDDVTFLVKCANFDTNNRYRNFWTMEASNQNLNGGWNTNKCAESWHAAFTLSQELTDMPNGFYTMTVQAALREDVSTWTGAQYAVAYLNDFSTPFAAMENKQYTDYVEYKDNGATEKRSFNPAVNGSAGMVDFSQLFTEKLYTITVPAKVTDGKITLGVKGTRTDTWCIFDNFTLTFMGDDATDYEPACAAAILEAYNEVFAALQKEEAIVEDYSEYTQAAVADEALDIIEALGEIKTQIEAAAEAKETYLAEEDLLAALAAVAEDINAYAKNAADVEEAYNELAADFEDAEETWRDANAEIGALDEKYEEGQILTQDVLDLLNEANSLLKDVKDALADGSVVIADANKAIADALDYVDQALALAAANVKDYLSLPTGEYYLSTTYDNKTYYLGGANDYGTHASLVQHSTPWTLVKLATNLYALDGYQNNGGEYHYLGENDYVDRPLAESHVHFIEQEDGTYILSINDGSGYLCVSNPSGVAKLPTIGKTDNIAEALKWTVVSTAAENIKKYDDVTYLIKDANFDQNNRWGSQDGKNDKGLAWKMEAGNQNLCGGEDWNRNAESWRSAFTLSQTIEGIPNGYYTLTAQAAVQDYAEKYDGANYPVVYANEASAPFIDHAPEARGKWMTTFSGFFSNGQYLVTVPVKVTDGKLTIGAKGTRTDTWAIFDNFALKFMDDDITDYNDAPYAELKEALEEVRAENAAAKAEVAALDQFVQDAVKDEIDRITTLLQDENVTHEEDETIIVDVEVINQKIEAAYAAKECATQKEAILAELAQLSEDIEAYLENAQNLQDNNDKAYANMDAAYEALVEKWQNAYDKVNTEYKEYFNSNAEAYDGYLKQLNSLYVDIDALAATIEGYKVAGTAQAKEEEVLAVIKTDADNVDLILATALNNYNDEVCVANQIAFKAVTDRCDEITAAYKTAIVVVSEHYAEYHSELAAEAQVALFEIYTQVQTIKTEATEEYAEMEQQNAADFKAENLPLASYAPNAAAWLLALEVVNTFEIDAIMEDLEDDAAAESAERNAELLADNEEVKDALAALKALIAAYDLKEADYAKQINSIQGHIDYVDNACQYPDHLVSLVDMTFTRRDTGSNHITVWGVYGSDDPDAAAEDWVKVATLNTPYGTPKETLTRAFDSKGYQYLRFYFEGTTSGSVFSHMAEFQLSVDGENLITKADQLSSPCSDSAEGVGDAHGLQVLLDGDANTFWHSDWHGQYTGGTHYIQVALAEPVEPALNCAMVKTSDVEAQIEAAVEEIAALTATITDVRGDNLLAEIKKQAEAAKKDLEAALPATYEPEVKEMFAEAVDAIATMIDDAVAEAEEANEAGTLIAEYDEIAAEIGTKADVYQETIEIEMKKGNGSSFDDNLVNDKPSIKVGTSSNTGSAQLVVPAGVKTVTFKAVAWKGLGTLELSVTDGTDAPAKKFTIQANDGLTGTSPYTIDETEDMVVTYEFDAETEAEVVLDIAADKRFIIWDADCPDAAENSAYALINSLAPEAKLVNCYVVDNKAIAQLNDNLAAAVEVITGLVGQDEDVADEIDEIAGDIALIASNVEALFETETLVANDEDIKWLIEEAQNDIDALLAECYQDDLVKKISDVKTTWNLEYAQLETTGQLTDDQKALFDDIYDQIYALADQIEDTDDYTAKTWAEDDAKVANLALFFSDFSQYIKDNYILGDANLNFDVTVSDAVLAVSFVLETATPNERQQYTADVNQDGEISVTDAVSIVDIALGFEPVAAGVKAMAPVASEDYLVLDGAEISLFNEKSYRGFQMDIMAEDGAAIDVELGARAAGLQIFKNKRADGSTRIVALSLTGGSIEAQEGLLLTVKGSSKFTVSNVEFTGTDKVAYALKVQSATGISGIKAGYEGESIYTIGGARLNKIQKSGVYVVNGKKVLVK